MVAEIYLKAQHKKLISLLDNVNDTVVHHMNSDKLDNDVSNLMWCNNAAHAVYGKAHKEYLKGGGTGPWRYPIDQDDGITWLIKHPPKIESRIVSHLYLNRN